MKRCAPLLKVQSSLLSYQLMMTDIYLILTDLINLCKSPGNQQFNFWADFLHQPINLQIDKISANQFANLQNLLISRYKPIEMDMQLCLQQFMQLSVELFDNILFVYLLTIVINKFIIFDEIFLRWKQFFFQADWGLGKELLPLAEGFLFI